MLSSNTLHKTVCMRHQRRGFCAVHHQKRLPPFPNIYSLAAVIYIHLPKGASLFRKLQHDKEEEEHGAGHGTRSASEDLSSIHVPFCQGEIPTILFLVPLEERWRPLTGQEEEEEEEEEEDEDAGAVEF